MSADFLATYGLPIVVVAIAIIAGAVGMWFAYAPLPPEPTPQAPADPLIAAMAGQLRRLRAGRDDIQLLWLEFLAKEQAERPPG